MAGGFEDSWPLNATKNRGTLLCPKCDCRMVQCLFNGITVEQCENCRGIFFDEGEVDELMGKSRLASRN